MGRGRVRADLLYRPAWWVALAAVLAGAAWGTGAALTPGGGAPRFEGYPLAGRTFLVDPGHGGVDSGCHLEGQVLEKETVLAVGLHLTQRLREAGARTGITRNQDMELGHMAPRGGSRYHRDLAMRAALARRLQPDLFISLHANASRRASMGGAIVFYGLARPEGRRVAHILLEELRLVVPGNQNAALPADFYLLREIPYPAVLVELGFLTHPRDRSVLTSPDGQRALAAALFRSVVRLHEREPGNEGEPPRLHDGIPAWPGPVQTAEHEDSTLCPPNEPM